MTREVNSSAIDGKNFYLPGEAAEYLGVSTQMINRFKREGRLKPVKLGSKTYFYASSVRRLKQDRQTVASLGEKITTNDYIAYSIEGVCEITSLGRTTVYELIQSGKFEQRRVGRRVVILRDSVVRFFAELEASASV